MTTAGTRGSICSQHRLPDYGGHLRTSHRPIVLAAELPPSRKVTVDPSGRTVLIEEIGPLPEAVPVDGSADQGRRIGQMLEDGLQTAIRALLVARCRAGIVLQQFHLDSGIPSRRFRSVLLVELSR